MDRVIIRVDSSVRILKAALPFKLSENIKTAFTFDNPEYHLHRSLNTRGWWKRPQTVSTWTEDKNYLVLPRGGLGQVRTIFNQRGVGYKIRDDRSPGGTVDDEFPTFKGVEPSWKGFEDLHYYQREAIDAGITRQNCVIRMPTGSGKSLMAIALAAKARVNTLVILPTVGLFTQWREDAVKALGVPDSEIGIIHQKKRVLRPITATVQGTLASRGVDDELNDYFGMIIVDEVQKCAATSYMRVVGSFSSKYRIGISADERRKDKKEFLTNGLFGSVVYEKKRKELEDEGFISDVEIRVVPTAFEAPWYGIADEDDEDDDKTLNFTRLVDEMMGDDARNKLALEYAFSEIENGEQVLMLAHRREHCVELDREFVKKQIRTGYFIGGNDYRPQFEATREGIKNGSLQVGVGTYQALGVGVNLPKVGVGVAVTPIAGNRFNFNQVRGRLNRKSAGKQRAVLYVLWDRNVYPKHLANMVQWNPTVKVRSLGKWIEGRHYLKDWNKKLKRKKENPFA